ncbi:MAG: preprotein translocase subunit YajC, partial [Phycisphaerales bacterium]|nr:preprotein translocase subunit YajC [Phycisphaerales bacterium]
PTAVQGAPGAAPGAAPPADAGGGTGFLLMIVAFAVVLFVIVPLSERRARKKREALLNSVKKLDKVQTSGGIIGTVVELKPDTITLKVDESHNLRITFARSAIVQILDASSSSPSTVSGEGQAPSR